MDTPVLSTPIVDVILADGSVLEVQTDNRDLIAFDKTRLKHKWAPAQDAPAFWVTFITWSHLRREQLIPTAMTWESFADEHCLQASVRDEGEASGVPPTRPGAEPA